MRVVAAFAILCLLPMAQAIPGVTVPDGPTPTTLYLHVDGFQDVPMTTRPPHPEYTFSDGMGVATHSVCVEDPTDRAFGGRSYHSYYSYFSPGVVRYDTGDGQPRHHPDRGLAGDLELGEGPMTLWLTLRSHATSGDWGANDAPVVVPDVVVRGTVRHGDDLSPGHEAMDSGEIVARGQTPPTLLAAEWTSGDHVVYEEVDGQHLYTFRVEMPIRQPSIPQEESFNLRIDVFTDNPYCADPADPAGYTTLDLVRRHSDAEHRPRLEFEVFDALRSDHFEARFIRDELVLYTSTSSPWGNSDIVPPDDDLADSVDVRIDGPADPTLDVLYYHEYGCHCTPRPVDGTFVWRDISESPAGVYNVTITVPNGQHTAEVVYAFQFEVGDTAPKVCMGEDPERFCVHDGKKAEVAPGSAPWLLVTGLLGLVLLRRQ